MNENYVTLSLETYDELKEKAKNFDELKEKLGVDIEKVLKDFLDGLVRFADSLSEKSKENENRETVTNNNLEKEGK